MDPQLEANDPLSEATIPDSQARDPSNEPSDPFRAFVTACFHSESELAALRRHFAQTALGLTNPQ